MEEIWKPVIGFDGLYEVSNLGRVKSIKFNKEKILKPQDNGRGYLTVHIRNFEYDKKHYIHRIVAETFLEKKDGKNEVNHIDCNKNNNCLNNLEWCTKEYNFIHKMINQRQPKGEESGNSKLTEKDILEIRKSSVNSYELSKIYNVSREHILRIKKKKTWAWL